VGAKFHASKLHPEQVSSFRMMEREKADKMLDEYFHQCSKTKVPYHFSWLKRFPFK
jgi:hypothetical protein